MALAAKLWLVSYTHDAFSVGSSYERAMKRQEVYNGILAWRMGAVINSLPVILLIALIMFGFAVQWDIFTSSCPFSIINIILSLSISPIQAYIGYVVGAILVLGLTTLLVTSLVAAFCASCPFRSSFSTIIQLVFNFLQKLSRWMCRGLSRRQIRWMWIGNLTILWVASCALIAYASVVNSTGFLALICIPVAITIAYAAHEEITHKPQEYKVPHLVFLMFTIIAPPLAAVPPFTGLKHQLSFPIVFSLYAIGILVLFFTGWMGGRMAVSMVETGEVDAIVWLLTSTSSQDPESFKKAGQIASLGSNGPHYRPRLLKSLMPLLSLLITSHRNDRIDMLGDQQMHHLEIYVSCLAILSDFEDYEGSFWLMREDARQHPKLDSDPKVQPLRNKLVELARNPRYCSSLRSASAKVLYNYGLDSQGMDILWAALLRSKYHEHRSSCMCNEQRWNINLQQTFISLLLCGREILISLQSLPYICDVWVSSKYNWTYFLFIS